MEVREEVMATARAENSTRGQRTACKSLLVVVQEVDNVVQDFCRQCKWWRRHGG